MKIIDTFLSAIFPPYKYKLERRGNEKLIQKIINQLPPIYTFLIEQKKVTKTLNFSDRQDIPNFKFITQFYPGESLRTFTDKTKNFKISGIQIYSKKNNKFEDLELLIHNGHLTGIKVSNSNYHFKEFDVEQVKSDQLSQSEFHFEPSDSDLLYDSLDKINTERIDELSFMDIQLGNRTYYTIFDLEDGNYIGIDKNQKVYSLIHDAIPMAKLMRKSLNVILTELHNGEFNISDHLDERYTNSK